MSPIRVVRDYLYLTAAVLTICFFVFRLWLIDWSTPLYYLTDQTQFPALNFDINLYLAIVKNIAEGNWITNYPRLGAPESLNYANYPHVYFEMLPFFLIKTILSFGIAVGAAVNVFFILTYLIVASASFYLLTQLGITRFVAGCCSILYAFLPYHMLTGQMHLCLSFYSGVPLTILVCIWLINHQFTDVSQKLDQKKFLIALVCLLLASSNDAYYTFYTLMFLIIAGVYANFNLVRPNINLKLSSRVWGALILFYGLVNFVPVFMLTDFSPESSVALQRNWTETQIWGFQLFQLFLPIRDHFLVAFAKFSNSVSSAISPNPNESVALGILPSIGCLILLSRHFIARSADSPILTQLSRLNLFAILFGLSGGLATLFALFFMHPLRANYRIVTYIGLFAVITLAFILSNYLKNKAGSRVLLIKVGLGLLTIVGVLDQNINLAIPNYKSAQSIYAQNQTYFLNLEKKLPIGSKIFQLPFASFPEGMFINRIDMYDYLLPFFHSQSLRWSYGARRESKLEDWNRATSSLRLVKMLPKLKSVGYSGVLFDLYGYLKPEKENLQKALKELGVIELCDYSANGRYLFIPIL